MLTTPLRAFRFSLILMAAALWVLPAFAQQQDMNALLDRIERLERNINMLQRELYKSGGAPAADGAEAPSGAPSGAMASDVAGSMQVRIGELENLVTNLTGQLEKAAFENRRLSEELDRINKDSDYRLTRLEEKTGILLSPTGEPGAQDGTVPVTPSDTVAAQQVAITLPEGTELEQYKFAMGLMEKERMPEAEAAFKAFLEAHPKGDLTSNAYYWLGETYFARQDYRTAAETFLEGGTKFPKSLKAPDLYLKAGVSLGLGGQPDAACSAFGLLARDHPNAPENIKLRAKKEKKTYGCE